MTTLRVIVAVVLAGMTALAQAPANRTQVSGTIVSVDAEGNKISLKSDKGDDVTVTTTARTLLLKMPPGETDPNEAERGGIDRTFADIVTRPAIKPIDPDALAGHMNARRQAPDQKGRVETIDPRTA